MLVRRRLPQLLALEGEPFRVLSFGTGRTIGRLRSLHVLTFLALIFFTPAVSSLGWLTSECLAAALALICPALGAKNLIHSGAYPAIASTLGGLVLFLTFVVTAAKVRGAWIEIEQKVFRSKLTARRFYFSLLRAQLIAILPVVVIIGLSVFFPSLSTWGFKLTILYAVILAILSPLLFRLGNRRGKKRDPALDEMLAALRQRTGVRCGQILIWSEPTGRITNALAAGLIPRYRRIYVTEALLTRLSPDEVRAVLAHEFGHFKHHDVAKRLTVSLLVIWLIYEGTNRLGELPWYNELPAGTTFFLYFLVGIPLMAFCVGFLARRQEFRADRYAGEVIDNPALLVDALRKIHEASAVPSSFGRFQRLMIGHPSLLERIQALESHRSATSPAGSQPAVPAQPDSVH